MKIKKQLTIISLLFALINTSTMLGNQAKLRLGTLGHSLGFLQVDISEALGWLETENLSTKIIYFKSGKECATALLSGRLDAAILGIDHAITAQLRGIAIKQTALLNRLPGWTFVGSKRIKELVSSPSDLSGMRIGVTSPGSATHILTAFLLSKYGLQQDKFTVVKAGSATLPDIMRKNGIDAGMAMEPYGSSLLSNEEAFLIVDFRLAARTREHLGSLYPLTALLLREDFIIDNRTATQDITNSIVWACKWLNEASAEDVLNLLPQDYIPNPLVWKDSFEASREVFPTNGRNDIEGIRTVLDAQVVFGKLTSQDQVDVNALYDESFWIKADAIPLPTIITPPKVDEKRSQLLYKKSLLILLCMIAFVFVVILIRHVLRRSKGD